MATRSSLDEKIDPAPRGIALTYFDTGLRTDSPMTRRIDHCAAAYLFPDSRWTISKIDPDTAVVGDLTGYDDRSLQFSNGGKLMFFADRPVRGLVYPADSDAIAYGSLLFTPCLHSEELRGLRVAVIDHETGANTIGLSRESARALVADCWGRISLDLVERLTAPCRDGAGISDRPIQFRLAIRGREGGTPLDEVSRIAKGTLFPTDLEDLSRAIDGVETLDGRAAGGFDLILPLSAFKGRKGVGERELTPLDGEADIWIGVKKIAATGIHRLGTQFLVNYPEATAGEALAIVGSELRELEGAGDDPLALARYYIEVQDRRRDFVSESLPGELDNAAEGEWFGRLFSEIDPEGSFESDFEGAPREDPRLYRLVKEQLESENPILMEHPEIAKGLREFSRGRYLDLATGRGIEFKTSMAQPGHDLGFDEICVPELPEGGEVILTRSPLLNSNGVIVLKNRHIPLARGIRGAIFINPERFRIDLGGDFDGDNGTYEAAVAYPILTREIREAQKPENRYPDVFKPTKTRYTGTIEEIALACADNRVGTIANMIQRAIALHHETILAPPEEKRALVVEASRYYSKLLKNGFFERHEEKNTGWLAERPENGEIIERYRVDMEALARSGASGTITDAGVEEGLARIRRLQFGIAGDLGNPFQIAVDGLKNAERPDMVLVQLCGRVSRYREVPWLAEKKNDEVYATRPMRGDSHDPISILVGAVNRTWRGYSATVQESHRYRDLLGPPEPSPELERRARELRGEYEALVNRARAIERDLKKDKFLSRPHLAITVTSGEEILISRMEEFGKRPDAIGAPDRVEIVAVPDDKLRPYLAIANGETIGAVSPVSIETLEKPGYIAANSRDRLGAALALDTLAGLNNYNARRKPGAPRVGVDRNFPVTIDGREYVSAMVAFREIGRDTRDRGGKKALLEKIQFEKLKRYPGLVSAIADRGGARWLEGATVTGNGNTVAGFAIAGSGKRSPLVEATLAAYSKLAPARESFRVLRVEAIGARPGLNDAIVGDLREKAEALLESARRSPDLDELTRHLWRATFTKTDRQFEGFKKGSIAFKLNPELILKTIRDPVFPPVRVNGIPDNAHAATVWSGDLVRVVFRDETDPNAYNFGRRVLLVDGKPLGPIEGDSYPGLDGMEAEAAIRPVPSGKVTVRAGDLSLVIGETAKYGRGERVWSGESETVRVTVTGDDTIVASVGGIAIGALDKNSRAELYAGKILGGGKESAELTGAILETVPPRSAIVTIDPSTVRYRCSSLTRAERIAYREALALRSALPVNPDNPLPMNFPLELKGAAPERGITSTADATRYLGRHHTTRTYSPGWKHGFKEGDVVVCADAEKNLIAFRAGKQYKISREMVENPEFRARWAEMEKHHPDTLLDLWRKKVEYHRGKERKNARGDGGDEPYLWGLYMEPLGDWDASSGRIVPFTARAPGINIAASGSDPLGAALANATERASERGAIDFPYPVSYRDNPEGRPYRDAGEAYRSLAGAIEGQSEREALAADIVYHKLLQYPELLEAITERGGVDWLQKCRHLTDGAPERDPWQGSGAESGFIRSLIAGYDRAVAITAAIGRAEPSLVDLLRVKYPNGSDPGELTAIGPVTDPLVTRLVGEWSARHGTPTVQRDSAGRDLLIWAIDEPDDSLPFTLPTPDGDCRALAGFPIADVYEYANCHAPAGVLKPDDLTLLVPIAADNPDLEKNRVKDRAMAAVSTGIIAFSAAKNPNAVSSTEDYRRGWGTFHLANTGKYTAADTIMISASGPWRGVTERDIQEVFRKNYLPLLDRAVAARARFVVGEALGGDRLAIAYLEKEGYTGERNAAGFRVYSPPPVPVEREEIGIAPPRTIERDILTIDIGVIAHQVNCRGVFGSETPRCDSANLATRIRYNPAWIAPPFVNSVVYIAYREKHESEGWRPGDIQAVAAGRDLYAINVAGQDGYGTDRDYTDLDALRRGLEKAAAFARERGLPLYLPAGIGVGLGGSNREAIHAIVREVCPEAILCEPPKELTVGLPPEAAAPAEPTSIPSLALSPPPDLPLLIHAADRPPAPDFSPVVGDGDGFDGGIWVTPLDPDGNRTALENFLYIDTGGDVRFLPRRTRIDPLPDARVLVVTPDNLESLFSAYGRSGNELSPSLDWAALARGLDLVYFTEAVVFGDHPYRDIQGFLDTEGGIWLNPRFEMTPYPSLGERIEEIENFLERLAVEGWNRENDRYFDALPTGMTRLLTDRVAPGTPVPDERFSECWDDFKDGLLDSARALRPPTAPSPSQDPPRLENLLARLKEGGLSPGDDLEMERLTREQVNALAVGLKGITGREIAAPASRLTADWDDFKDRVAENAALLIATIANPIPSESLARGARELLLREGGKNADGNGYVYRRDGYEIFWNPSDGAGESPFRVSRSGKPVLEGTWRDNRWLDGGNYRPSPDDLRYFHDAGTGPRQNPDTLVPPRSRARSM